MDISRMIQAKTVKGPIVTLTNLLAHEWEGERGTVTTEELFRVSHLTKPTIRTNMRVLVDFGVVSELIPGTWRFDPIEATKLLIHALAPALHYIRHLERGQGAGDGEENLFPFVVVDVLEVLDQQELSLVGNKRQEQQQWENLFPKGLVILLKDARIWPTVLNTAASMVARGILTVRDVATIFEQATHNVDNQKGQVGHLFNVRIREFVGFDEDEHEWADRFLSLQESEQVDKAQRMIAFAKELKNV